MGLTVACVQVGNYEKCGAEYVNKLAAMVRRNITVPYRFACVTDDASGLDDGIEVIQPPTNIRNIKGWFTKLYLFAPGTFPKGERIVYLDLDTLILTNIDDFASYGGPFAGLGQFREKVGGGPFGSGLMLWEAGSVDHIWTEWVRLAHPLGDGTDDSWIAAQVPQASRIQRVLPGVVSYKFHKCRDGPPKGARVVCFQRRPKCHDCGAKWVSEVWRT